MSDTATSELTVAHFRRAWFKATETFLHTTLAHAHHSRPLLVGCQRVNEEAFPIEAPIVCLDAPGSWGARWRALRRRLPGAPSPFDDRRTYRALRRWRARCLHAHFGYTGVQLLPVRWRTGLPLVTTFYGEDVSRLAEDPTWRARYQDLFAEGDVFLAEGPFMRERLVGIGCPPEKTAIQPIAIDPDRYPFRARQPRPRGETVRLFFCASFRQKKGLLYALEAVARARREHPGLELRVAGEGPQRDEVEAALDRLSLRDVTSLLGFVSHARMIEEMDRADLFLQPSVTADDGDSEGGAPTTLLEAQACGLPVLATRHADIPYVVDEDESALLAPERDVDRLCENLLTLMKDPERWSEMGAAGRAHVERFHHAAVEVPRLEALYRNVVEASA